MNKTDIEWVKNPDGSRGYTWNPITGCENHTNGICKGGGFPCYAYRLANGRLKQRYLMNNNIAPKYVVLGLDKTLDEARLELLADPFYPRFWPERLDQPMKVKKPSGIFVSDMGELFGDRVPRKWQDQIFDVIRACSQHRFYLLTKCPWGLPKFNPFPSNCFVGLTITNQEMFDKAIYYLKFVDAKVKFLSMEPLLEHVIIDKQHQ